MGAAGSLDPRSRARVEIASNDENYDAPMSAPQFFLTLFCAGAKAPAAELCWWGGCESVGSSVEKTSDAEANSGLSTGTGRV